MLAGGSDGAVCVAGCDMLQARGAGQLLPAEDGAVRLRQRALPPRRGRAQGKRAGDLWPRRAAREVPPLAASGTRET